MIDVLNWSLQHPIASLAWACFFLLMMFLYAAGSSTR